MYACINNGYLGVFSIDETTGEITLLQEFYDGYGGVDGLSGAQCVEITPDGKSVYVAGNSDDAVALFSRDSSTGLLTYETAYIDDTDGVSGLDGVTTVTVSPDGRHVYTGSEGDDSVVCFSRDTDTGALTYLYQYKDDTEFGVGPSYYKINGLEDISDIVVSPDGETLFVGSLGNTSEAGAVAWFIRDTSSGELTYKDYYSGASIQSVVELALSPDGNLLYFIDDYYSTLKVYSWDDDAETLLYKCTYYDDVLGVDGLHDPTSLTISADGNWLYVTADGTEDNSIAVYSRDTATGDITLEDIQRHGYTYNGEYLYLNHPQSLRTTADGNYAFVATPSGSCGISVFQIGDIADPNDFSESGHEDTVIVIDGWNVTDADGEDPTHIGFTGLYYLAVGGVLFLDDGDNVYEAGEEVTFLDKDDPTTWITWEDATSGKLKFLPDAEWSGSTSLTYKVRDSVFEWYGQNTDATVTINVDAANDAPVLSTDGEPEITEIVNVSSNPGDSVADIIIDGVHYRR